MGSMGNSVPIPIAVADSADSKAAELELYGNGTKLQHI